MPPDRLPSFGDSRTLRLTLWLAEHRPVLWALVVAVCAVIGYYGAWGRGNATKPFGEGTGGLLFGVAVGILVLVCTQVSLMFQRRRRR